MKKDNIRNASTSHKIARNLRQQFDQYTLREQNSENQDSNQYKIDKQQQTIKENKQIYNLHNKPLPKSYLLAMQSLQQSLLKKDQEIERLKNKLIQKQNDMLSCQTRINQALKKCKELSQINQEKDIQHKLLKAQIIQLQKDKSIALKQASKLLHSDMRQINAQQIIQTNNKIIRQRSKTVLQNPNNLASYPSYLNSKASDQFPKNYMQIDQYSDGCLLKTPVQSLNFISPLISQKSKNRDYISYQRQILRNQKQMVALNYRVECLERKLSSQNNKQQRQEIKLKLKKLQHDIDIKQRLIIDLKKV